MGQELSIYKTIHNKHVFWRRRRFSIWGVWGRGTRGGITRIDLMGHLRGQGGRHSIIIG
jgi:hypothetical protein